MSLPYPIAPSQTAALAPVDDNLMDSIRLDLGYLDASIIAASATDYFFKANGSIAAFPQTNGIRKRIDGAIIAEAHTFSRCRLFCGTPGASGTLEIDIRKYKS